MGTRRIITHLILGQATLAAVASNAPNFSGLTQYQLKSHSNVGILTQGCSFSGLCRNPRHLHSVAVASPSVLESCAGSSVLVRRQGQKERPTERGSHGLGWEWLSSQPVHSPECRDPGESSCRGSWEMESSCVHKGKGSSSGTSLFPSHAPTPNPSPFPAAASL